MVVTDLLIQNKLLWEVADTRVRCKNNTKKNLFIYPKQIKRVHEEHRHRCKDLTETVFFWGVGGWSVVCRGCCCTVKNRESPPPITDGCLLERCSHDDEDAKRLAKEIKPLGWRFRLHK